MNKKLTMSVTDEKVPFPAAVRGLGSITSRCSGNEPSLSSPPLLSSRGGRPGPRERRKSSLSVAQKCLCILSVWYNTHQHIGTPNPAIILMNLCLEGMLSPEIFFSRRSPRSSNFRNMTNITLVVFGEAQMLFWAWENASHDFWKDNNNSLQMRVMRFCSLKVSATLIFS